MEVCSSAVIPFLPIVIVFSINEVITGIQAVEQAKECGDTYFTTTKPLVICGIAKYHWCLLWQSAGSWLILGLSGMEKMESGTGYHMGIVALYAMCWFNRSGCNFKCILFQRRQYFRF